VIVNTSLTRLIGIVLATAIAAVSEPALAQERELPLDSLEQAVELDQGAGDLFSDFRISGFGVADYGYQFNTDNNTFGATKLALSVFTRAGPYVSFFGQFTTLFEFERPGEEEEEEEGALLEVTSQAAAGRLSSSGGEEGEEGAVLETEIDNLILSVTVPGFTNLTFWLGRFDAPLGFERDDEPLNFQPTLSFNFEFARPVKFTGLLARYVPIPQLAIAGYVVNGWDVALDNNNAKTLGGRVSFLPHEYTAISLNGVYGAEKEDNTDDKRFLLDADFTVQPVRALILGGEFNYGTEENSAEDGGDADWIGGLLTGFIRFTRHFGVTLRYDVLDDKDGGRTGASRTLQSFTVAPMVFYRSAVSGIFANIPGTSFELPQFQVRGGLRYNKSSNPFFAGAEGLEEDEWQVVAEGVFVY
jgi:hypothetical protein